MRFEFVRGAYHPKLTEPPDATHIPSCSLNALLGGNSTLAKKPVDHVQLAYSFSSRTDANTKRKRASP